MGLYLKLGGIVGADDVKYLRLAFYTNVTCNKLPESGHVHKGTTKTKHRFRSLKTELCPDNNTTNFIPNFEQKIEVIKKTVVTSQALSGNSSVASQKLV